MKTLFIIGNGLPTKYIDYREYMKNNKETEDFLMSLENTYGVGKKKDIWWQDFEMNLGEGYEFEVEFENMAYQTIEEMVTDDGDEMYDIEDTLNIYFEDYYKFMRKLNETVLKWINSIDLSGVKRITKRIHSEESLYFSFNYTDVLEKIYDIPEEKVCHIHGSKCERQVIMGHGNIDVINKFKDRTIEEENRFEKNRATVSNGIYEFYTASFKDTKKIIEEHTLEFNKYSGVKEIHIYGHSFGEVDIPYFKEIKKKVLKDADWYFYIYCKPIEFVEVKKEWKNKLKNLRICDKHLHILSTDSF